MHNVSARFTAYAKVNAKLSTGEEIQCYTLVEADGLYSSWWEYPYEPYMGSVNFVEQDVDESDIRPVFKDEWEFVDENKQKYLEEDTTAFADVYIEEIVSFIEQPEWTVDEDSIGYEQE